MLSEQILAISWRNQITYQCYDDARTVLDPHLVGVL